MEVRQRNKQGKKKEMKSVFWRKEKDGRNKERGGRKRKRIKELQ